MSGVGPKIPRFSQVPTRCCCLAAQQGARGQGLSSPSVPLKRSRCDLNETECFCLLSPSLRSLGFLGASIPCRHRFSLKRLDPRASFQKVPLSFLPSLSPFSFLLPSSLPFHKAALGLGPLVEKEREIPEHRQSHIFLLKPSVGLEIGQNRGTQLSSEACLRTHQPLGPGF